MTMPIQEHDTALPPADDVDSKSVKRLSAQTLADRACDMLDQAILNGELPPGTQISEAELALRLGISRGPLREAISRLEGRRLIERVPHIGVRVVALSDWDVSEIFAIREVMEGLACRLATLHMSDAELDELENCVEFRHVSAEPPPTSPFHRKPHKWDFHSRVAQGSRNTQLIQYLCGDMYYLLRLYRARTGVTPMRAGADDEHRNILRAMRARDGELAERLMRQHVAGSRASLGLSADINAGDSRGAEGGAKPRMRRINTRDGGWNKG
ncbi:GntR family transcriptional regulator [Paraburkholderia jirisanensis]